MTSPTGEAIEADATRPRALRPPSDRWVLALIVATGAVLRFALARQDLFADELATYWVVTTRGAADVVRTVSTTAEITPPLSFLLSWATTRIGRSPELLRLPALLAGIATIPLVHAVGLRTAGRRAALLAAALTALSPFMAFYSAEARGYGVLMALVLASTWTLLRAVDSGHRLWWVAHALCVALAAYTHYTAVFVLAAQLLWALVVHPGARRPLLTATAAAAVLYVPWLPGLRGDLDSPTTEILAYLSPFDLEAAQVVLGHWMVGFPFPGEGRALRDLPGTAALVLLVVGLGAAAVDVVVRRARRPERADRADPAEQGATRRGLVLLAVLAVVTPAGAIAQSLLSTDVFSVRSLAASWPYLALAVATVVAAARPPLRSLASVLLVAGMAVGAVTMLGPDYRRPEYSTVTRLADDRPGSVIVSARLLSPGPLTNFEVEGSQPREAPVFRLLLPQQMERPFTLGEARLSPPEVMAQAVAAAAGAPVIVVAAIPEPPVVLDALALLPDGYRLAERFVLEGIYPAQVLVYERAAG
ncbi:MAG: glycosyltransferase family 39 protein [Acidimicrobiales bacterium]